jgi:group I intron endonuclease
MSTHFELPTLYFDQVEGQMNQDENKKIWGFIYLFTISGKGYVGQAVNLKRRIKEHFTTKNSNFHFHNSLRKYFQPKCFRVIEVHHEVPKNLKFILDEREMFWIDELKTYDPEQRTGWNLTKGGNGCLGRKCKEEIKERLKEKYTGIRRPLKAIEKMKGPKSELHKKHMKDNHADFRGELHPRAKLIRLISPEGKKYEIKSYSLFCKEHDLNRGHICDVLKNKRPHHKGWIGEYLEK